MQQLKRKFNKNKISIGCQIEIHGRGSSLAVASVEVLKEANSCGDDLDDEGRRRLAPANDTQLTATICGVRFRIAPASIAGKWKLLAAAHHAISLPNVDCL